MFMVHMLPVTTEVLKKLNEVFHHTLGLLRLEIFDLHRLSVGF